ncbi:ABC transporter ATP-binding protein [Fusibacter sp. 3D3]|uniref:ABC transporter ATP-binding protein n=1 Tax=Fusibacter sp. 3D3 TaxID=1048380 RepID=UPI000853136A|nr:oligopeptide/dipeptide ABC transporter ATP-binding protein [Fusibacter sp. 3D3]GAU79476.1 oligopeptide transport ATP-binding protein OppF [Fusibacter sp. 3D3]
MCEKILEVKHLSKSYPLPKKKLLQKTREKSVIMDISFDITKGETFGLVGESGCGKSTTAKIITQLVKKGRGEILFEGKNLETRERQVQNNIKRNIQMIFQDPFGVLNPRKTIGWFLEEPLRIHEDLTAAERRARVLKILSEVGFDEHYYDRYPHELSGGQRQRVSIACALMLNPKLIIADEPVSALDVSVQSSVLNLMKDLQKKYALTYLFISHDLNVVAYMSDWIGVMYLGEIVEFATVDAIFDQPLHPYTQSLMASMPSVYGDKKKEKVQSLGEIGEVVLNADGCPFYGRCPKGKTICKMQKPINKAVYESHFVSCHLYSE